MDFLSFLGVLRRHWIVVFLCLAMTVGAAFVVHGRVKPRYTASTSMALLGPTAPPKAAELEEPDPQNPYIGGNNAVGLLVAIMTEGFLDPTLRETLTDQGATDTWTLDSDEPLLLIFVDGETPVSTMKTLQVVEDAVLTQIHDRQINAGASPDYLITASMLTRSRVPQPDGGGRTRALATVVLLGVAFAIGMAFLVEAVQQRRRRRTNPVSPRARASDASILERDAEPAAAVATRGNGVPQVARWGRTHEERPARRDPA